MARKPKPQAEDKEQSRRFVETARAIGADESGLAFDRALPAILPLKDKRKKRPRSKPS